MCHFGPPPLYRSTKKPTLIRVKHQKKSICAAFERLLIGWSKLSAYSLSRESSFSLIWTVQPGSTVQPRSDCPASASGLSWTTVRPWLDSRPWVDSRPGLGKSKFSHHKELRYRALSSLNNPSNAAQNIDFNFN